MLYPNFWSLNCVSVLCKALSILCKVRYIAKHLILISIVTIQNFALHEDIFYPV